MSIHKVTQDEIGWEEGDHPRFQARTKGLSSEANCNRLGCRLVEVPPGSAAWPFHYHLAVEEAIYVLKGSGTLRLGQQELPAKAGDYFALLPGKDDTAHQLRNTSNEVLQYLVLAIREPVDIVGYPDSDKLRFRAVESSDPSAKPWVRTFSASTPELDYYHGE